MSRADVEGSEAAEEPGAGARAVAGNGNGAAASLLALQVVEDIGQIDAQEWNDLLGACAAPTPFMRHEYLAALQRSGSAVAATGWQPIYLLLTDPGTGRLVGACTLYLKSHSYGEYVFDWAWADAWQKAGRDYYPKLLSAVPFTPVPGSRLLARDQAARVALLQGMQTLAREQGWSSAHLLFMDDNDRAAAEQAGWLLRRGVQFHWSNRGVADDTTSDQGVADDPVAAGESGAEPVAGIAPGTVATAHGPAPQPYRDWADYLASLTRDKRKKITQERGYVAKAGVDFEIKRGGQIDTADWDYFYRCYCNTYREHHSTPYLEREFFDQTHAALPDLWLMFIARRGNERVAASLLAIDAHSRTAWGRYWGCTEDVGHLHFAACYHEPLLWCVNQRWRRFEGGAQGEHKLARGLMPVATWSAHWLTDRGFSAAVARFLERERSGVASYMDELQAHSPFKSVP
ncbi:MAG: N-acetyltransferase [Burkholderiales bacterium]|nr:N-acetyltransferase [Burkholderiales bacterium]